MGWFQPTEEILGLVHLLKSSPVRTIQGEFDA
jgi:hypothetical protein